MYGPYMFQMWSSTLLLKTYQKLLIIMMMTTPGEWLEHMFQGGTGWA